MKQSEGWRLIFIYRSTFTTTATSPLTMPLPFFSNKHNKSSNSLAQHLPPPANSSQQSAQLQPQQQRQQQQIGGNYQGGQFQQQTPQSQQQQTAFQQQQQQQQQQNQNFSNPSRSPLLNQGPVRQQSISGYSGPTQAFNRGDGGSGAAENYPVSAQDNYSNHNASKNSFLDSNSNTLTNSASVSSNTLRTLQSDQGSDNRPLSPPEAIGDNRQPVQQQQTQPLPSQPTNNQAHRKPVTSKDHSSSSFSGIFHRSQRDSTGNNLPDQPQQNTSSSLGSSLSRKISIRNKPSPTFQPPQSSPSLAQHPEEGQVEDVSQRLQSQQEQLHLQQQREQQQTRSRPQSLQVGPPPRTADDQTGQVHRKEIDNRQPPSLTGPQRSESVREPVGQPQQTPYYNLPNSSYSSTQHQQSDNQARLSSDQLPGSTQGNHIKRPSADLSREGSHLSSVQNSTPPSSSPVVPGASMPNHGSGERGGEGGRSTPTSKQSGDNSSSGMSAGQVQALMTDFDVLRKVTLSFFYPDVH